MKNKERPEVIKALYDSIFDTGMYESALQLVLNFERKNGVHFSVLSDFKEWLNLEIPPYKISNLDYIVLSQINPVFEWVARDKNGELTLYVDKPKKKEDFFDSDSCNMPLDMFKNLLLCVTFEKSPIYIKDILSNHLLTDSELALMEYRKSGMD